MLNRKHVSSKYLLPVQVLVAAFGFIFGMLERIFSMPSEAVKTCIWQKTWETTGLCSDQLTATSTVLEPIQLGHETVARDPHVPLLLLMVCGHYTLLCLSTRYFHVQSIFFKVDFLQLKERANENVRSFFPFFRETKWFQHLTHLLPLPTARYSPGGHTGSVLPGAACSAVLHSAVLPLPCTVIAQPFSFTACTSPVWFMIPSILAV